MLGDVNNNNCRHCYWTSAHLCLGSKTLACPCWLQLPYPFPQCTVMYYLKDARTSPSFSAYFKSDSVLCNFFSWRWLVSVSLRMRSGVQCLSMQSSTWSQWKHMSSSAPFPVVPTRWRNCSHSADFHANHQDIFFQADSRLVVGHYLVRPPAWSSGNRILFFRGYVISEVWESRPANTGGLKPPIRKCIQGVP